MELLCSPRGQSHLSSRQEREAISSTPNPSSPTRPGCRVEAMHHLPQEAVVWFHWQCRRHTGRILGIFLSMGYYYLSCILFSKATCSLAAVINDKHSDRKRHYKIEWLFNQEMLLKSIY